MSVAMILLPLFVHVALLLGLLVSSLARRGAEPETGAGQLLASLLFATLTILTLVTRKADLVFLVLAWVFVAANLAASLPGAAGAALRDGRLAGLLAALALALAWAWFALHILLNI